MRIKETKLSDAKQIGERRELSRMPLTAFWALMPPLPVADFHGAVAAAIDNYKALQVGVLLSETRSKPAVEKTATRAWDESSFNHFVKITRTNATINGESLVIYEEAWEGWTSSVTTSPGG